MAIDPKSFDSQFMQGEAGRAFAGEYIGSKLQKETYKSLENQDILYKRFIAENYGSFENYLAAHRINESMSSFDPTRDFIMDVTVITDEERYKSDHISAEQVIMEALSGVCTVIFMKVNGSVGRITGTLDSRAIPSKDQDTRRNFFSPLPNSRVVMWDITKQGWRSFYMEYVIKFIRDDTIDLE
jgi:hypothetical protein